MSSAEVAAVPEVVAAAAPEAPAVEAVAAEAVAVEAVAAEGAAAEGAAAEGASSEDKPAAEDKPRKSIVAESMRKVQDAGKRAMDALKDAIARDVDATPTPTKFAELQRQVNEIMNKVVASHRSKRSRGARNTVSLNDSLKMIMDALLQAIELVERAHEGRIKSNKGKVIEVPAEARKQLVIDMVRVSVNHHAGENPTFQAAWNAFRITADATIDALIAVSRGDVKINAFAEKKKSSSCLFF